jgi:hypothetical protein
MWHLRHVETPCQPCRRANKVYKNQRYRMGKVRSKAKRPPAVLSAARPPIDLDDLPWRLPAGWGVDPRLVAAFVEAGA